MKINKTIIISDILSILIAFALFIWIFIEMKCVAIIYDRIINNLFIKDFNPIQQISLSRSECQEEDMSSLINYEFPGIREGCYDNISKKISLGKCTSNDENHQNIGEIKKKNFNIWRNKIICAKYFDYSKSSYKFIKYEGDESDCGSDYHLCGNLNKKSENQKIQKALCIKNNIECPLNYITITNDTSSYDLKDINIYSFENGHYLITSNKNITNGIITNIKIAEGELPCYEKGKYSNSTSQFPTINNENDFNCTSSNVDNYTDNYNSISSGIEEDDISKIKAGLDIRYTRFDSLPKYIVLEDNDIDYSYSKLPNLTNWEQDMFSHSFNLFYQNSLIIKDECENIEGFESDIKNLKKVQAIRVVFALFHILIYVLLFSILGLIKVIFSWRHSLLFGIKILISFIIFIANFILIYSSRNYISNLDSFEKKTKECLDKVSNAILRNHNINNIINSLRDYYDNEEIIWLFYIFFNFIEACRLVHKIYIRVKNTYRRNIANRDIGAENLKKIFENVRKALDQKEIEKEQ